MKRKSFPRNLPARKVASTVSAAALMLGVGNAATVAMHFQENYCGSASYSGFIVTLTAFGIPPSGWQNLMPMDTGYSACSSPMAIYSLNQVVGTGAPANGLNPLPNGSVNVTWTANAANFSGFAGYGGSPPSYGYDGVPPAVFLTGEWQVYSTFLRDGKNFGPINNNAAGSPCGDNSMPPYLVDLTGLKSVFTNSPYVVELIAAADSMQTLTNAFVIDVANALTNSVTYPGTPMPYGEGGTCSQWLRGHGGGLSTASGSFNVDHLQITSNQPQHGGTGVPPSGFDAAGTISGFIITDKPVITMAPQSVAGNPGDQVTLNPNAIGVAPLHYQWWRNGSAVAGATNASYSIPSLTVGMAGSYWLVVTNAYGSATSGAATVTVDRLTLTPGHDFVVDSNPANPPHNGVDSGAVWQASNSDGVFTRTGVMELSATNMDGITVPGETNFDSVSGSYLVWMRSSGTLSVPGNVGAELAGRNSTTLANDLNLVQADNGSIIANVPGSPNFIVSATTVSDNDWHLIALTYDSSAPGGATLYIDGVIQGTNFNGTAWSPPVGQELDFGHDSGGFYRAYDGTMDDIRFYNRQLTEAEILTVFATGGLVDTNALQLQLNFNTAPVPGFGISWGDSNTVLQSAPAVTGPYNDINASSSPYYVVPGPGIRFYRYRSSFPPATRMSNPYLM